MCCIATGCELSPFSGDDGAPLPPDVGVVVHVVDGDTVDLEIDGQTERVRLIGLDAPESVSRADPVQCYGPEASAALDALLPEGTALRLERDAEARDRYDRLLLYLYLPVTDGEVFVNEWLIANGFATTMFFEPNTTFEARFNGVRRDAEAAGVGLWGACDGPDQPLDPVD